MTNVMGPYDKADWKVMLTLRGSLRHMYQTDPTKYSRAIAKEEILYRMFKRGEVS